MPFIAFEGVDGVGKTSIINILIDMLSHHKLYIYSEPSNEFGYIAKYGDSNALLHDIDLLYLWWVARKYEIRKFGFQNADIILADRYYDSTYVYLNKYFDKHMTYHNYDSNFFPQPDITFVLEAESHITLTRSREDMIDRFKPSDITKIDDRKKIFRELTKLPQNKNRLFYFIETDGKSLTDIAHICLKYIAESDSIWK